MKGKQPSSLSAKNHVQLVEELIEKTGRRYRSNIQVKAEDTIAN